MTQNGTVLRSSCRTSSSHRLITIPTSPGRRRRSRTPPASSATRTATPRSIGSKTCLPCRVASTATGDNRRQGSGRWGQHAGVDDATPGCSQARAGRHRIPSTWAAARDWFAPDGGAADESRTTPRRPGVEATARGRHGGDHRPAGRTSPSGMPRGVGGGNRPTTQRQLADVCLQAGPALRQPDVESGREHVRVRASPTATHAWEEVNDSNGEGIWIWNAGPGGPGEHLRHPHASGRAGVPVRARSGLRARQRQPRAASSGGGGGVAVAVAVVAVAVAAAAAGGGGGGGTRSGSGSGSAAAAPEPARAPVAAHPRAPAAPRPRPSRRPRWAR